MVNPSNTTRIITRARKSLKPNLKLKSSGSKFRVYRVENNSYSVEVLGFEVLKLAHLTGYLRRVTSRPLTAVSLSNHNWREKTSSTHERSALSVPR